MELMKSKSAKFGIKSLGILFCDLIIFACFLPSINVLIGQLVPSFSDNPMAVMMLSLIPMFILIAISFGIFGMDDNK